jgi:hypothetical protein
VGTTEAMDMAAEAEDLDKEALVARIMLLQELATRSLLTSTYSLRTTKGGVVQVFMIVLTGPISF